MLQDNMSEKRQNQQAKTPQSPNGSYTATHVDQEREVIFQFCQTQAAYIFQYH